MGYGFSSVPYTFEGDKKALCQGRSYINPLWAYIKAFIYKPTVISAVHGLCISLQFPIHSGLTSMPRPSIPSLCFTEHSEGLYRHSHGPRCFPFCVCIPFLPLLGRASPKISLSLFLGTGWWCPILLRARPNLNLRRAILCLFIKNERTAGSKARCNAMGRLAFSREASWRTSEETHTPGRPTILSLRRAAQRGVRESTSADF